MNNKITFLMMGAWYFMIVVFVRMIIRILNAESIGKAIGGALSDQIAWHFKSPEGAFSTFFWWLSNIFWIMMALSYFVPWLFRIVF